MKRFRRCASLAAIIALTVMPIAAHAQTVGGEATGFGQLVRWVLGPVGGPIVALGAALVGIAFMAGRRDYEHLVHFGIGATIFAAAFAIAAFFITGGSF